MRNAGFRFLIEHWGNFSTMNTPKLTSFRNIFKNINSDKLLVCATTALVLWYVIICSAHYLGQRPLWNDEECVLRSLKAFQAKQFFTQELMALQVFPRLYLFLIYCISKPLDFNLLSLRFFPFVFMLAAFFVWLKIAGYALKNRLVYLTFVLSWLASAVLIYYSAELKQYSMDVLVGALFILFIYNQQRLLDEKRYVTCAMILALLPALLLFSYVSMFLLLIPFYNLALNLRRNKNVLYLLVLYGLSLLIVGALSYQFDVKWRPVAVLTREWRDYFVSTVSVPEFFKTLGEGTMNLLSRWFVERPRLLKKVALFFVIPGFLSMFYIFFTNIKKSNYRLDSLNTIALVIFIELFTMGIFKKYPFTVPRTSLFFCPIILYLTINAIVSLKNINVYLYRTVHSLYFIYLLYLMTALSGIALTGKLISQPVLW